MNGGWRRMLLVLTLIVGVLGMHALVMISTLPATGEQMPPSIAMASMTTAQPVLDHPDDPEHSAPQGAGHGSMPSSMHQVLHLCLAILAGLLVLGAAAFALWPSQPAGHQGISYGALARRAPRRRPPPTSVRLAQLCVLRN